MLLGLVALLGGGGRIAYVLSMRDTPIRGDGWTYHFAANDLADGEGFVDSPEVPRLVAEALAERPSGPLTLTPAAARQLVAGSAQPDANVLDASHPPLWSLVLGGFSALGLKSYLAQQLVASMLGAATTIAVGLAGHRLAGARVGLIAAGLAAAYPGFWVYERALLSETLVLLEIAVLINLAYRFRGRPSTGAVVGLGVLVGLLGLTRSEQVLLGVFLVVPLVLAARQVELRRRLAWVALAGVVTIVVITPWTLYNQPRFHHPVLLSSSFGSAVAQGSCPQTFSGPLLGHYSLSCALANPNFYLADQSDADSALRTDTWRFVRRNDRRVPIVLLARQGRVWTLFRVSQHVQYDAYWTASPRWVIWSWFGAYWAMLPLAVGGAIALRRRTVALFPLLAVPFVVVVATSLTFGETRYRAPAEVVLALLAAVAIDALAGTIWRTR